MKTPGRRPKTLKEILRTQRIREVLYIFAQNPGKAISPSIIKSRLPKEKVEVNGEVEYKPIMASAGQLDRDLNLLMQIGWIVRESKGAYRLTSQYLSEIHKWNLFEQLERLPTRIVRFEDRVSFFGIDTSFNQDNEMFSHKKLVEEYETLIHFSQDIAQRAEIFFIQVALAHLITNFENKLLKLRSIKMKASLYRDVNITVEIWLMNRHIDTNNPGPLLKSYIERIRKPKVPKLDKILETEVSEKSDWLDGFEDKNKKNIQDEVVIKQCSLRSTYEEAFNSLIEDEELILTERDRERIQKRFKQIDLEINDLWRGPYCIPSFNPFVIIGKDIKPQDRAIPTVPIL